MILPLGMITVIIAGITDRIRPCGSIVSKVSITDFVDVSLQVQ